MDEAIQVKGSEIYRYGAKIGYRMAGRVFLFEQISDAEWRRIADVTGCKERIHPGEFKFEYANRSK